MIKTLIVILFNSFTLKSLFTTFDSTLTTITGTIIYFHFITPLVKQYYIINDAGKAVQANPTAKKATQGPGNWADQLNDAATVLYYRKKMKIKVEGFEGPFSAPGSGSIAKLRKAKAGDENKSIEQQMADARLESLAFQENEWDSMWKNAAKSRPKMSFKQATEFVDEVGLDKKEKTNALKTAKKWLK